MTKKQKKNLVRIILSALALAAAAIVDRVFPGLPRGAIFAIYLAPYLAAGYDVLIKCGRNIVHGQLLDESFLMTVATVGAFALSLYDAAHNEFAEAVFVMLFYQTGELFQSVAVGKSRKSISELMNISPDKATVLRGGAEETVFPEELLPGDVIVVRPGEKIAADGQIVSGETELDTSALTGESVPAAKKTGDAVLSGSVNLVSMIKVRVEKAYDDSTVAKIIELIENSSLKKAKTELTLTKFARIYTPAVVGLAAALALCGSLITGQISVWLSRALIFLVVSCPCAIVISVPMAYFGGIGGASSRGILIKGSDHLEALANADTFVFDKTGTLTRGSFSVVSVRPAPGVTQGRLLRAAASAEYYSVHPIGVSLRASAGETDLPAPESFTNVPGKGISAAVAGVTVLAGSRLFLEENGVPVPDFGGENDGGTEVFVSSGGNYLGCVALEDTLRQGVDTALASLRARGIKKLIMLTGDTAEKAEKTGKLLGFDEVRSRLLPADKNAAVERLCAVPGRGGTVFVGDGINDAPALSLADVGIAMGGIGSDAAIEAADVVIMNDSPALLPEALGIAVKTKNIVRQNIVFALTVKILVLILASFGLAGMWLGAVADVGVAMVCILNSMRTLRGASSRKTGK